LRETKKSKGQAIVSRFIAVIRQSADEYADFYADVVDYGIATAIYNAGFIQGEHQNGREESK
jgi:hypothetical protein